jgi:hypothetical protein
MNGTLHAGGSAPIAATTAHRRTDAGAAPPDARPDTEGRLLRHDGLWYLRERHSDPIGPFGTRDEAVRALEVRLEHWKHPWSTALSGSLLDARRYLPALRLLGITWSARVPVQGRAQG